MSRPYVFSARTPKCFFDFKMEKVPLFYPFLFEKNHRQSGSDRRWLCFQAPLALSFTAAGSKRPVYSSGLLCRFWPVMRRQLWRTY